MPIQVCNDHSAFHSREDAQSHLNQLSKHFNTSSFHVEQCHHCKSWKIVKK